MDKESISAGVKLIFLSMLDCILPGVQKDRCMGFQLKFELLHMTKTRLLLSGYWTHMHESKSNFLSICKLCSGLWSLKCTTATRHFGQCTTEQKYRYSSPWNQYYCKLTSYTFIANKANFFFSKLQKNLLVFSLQFPICNLL